MKNEWSTVVFSSSLTLLSGSEILHGQEMKRLMSWNHVHFHYGYAATMVMMPLGKAFFLILVKFTTEVKPLLQIMFYRYFRWFSDEYFEALFPSFLLTLVYTCSILILLWIKCYWYSTFKMSEDHVNFLQFIWHNH